MPITDGDPPFSDAELLYRRLLRDWVDGNEVLPEAIELPAFSADRQALSTAEESLDRGRPQEVALGGIAVGDVPDTFPSPSGGKTLESLVVHCPEHDNAAHTEIRIRPVGAAQAKKLKNAVLKSQIKDAIAGRMKVVIPPPDEL